MSDIYNDKDDIFWKNYLDFPFDQLLENIEVLETKTENESEMQVVNDTKSIEDYLDKDITPPTSTTIEQTHEVVNQIMEHSLPQFIFAIDNIPPFYFLFPDMLPHK